MDHEYRYNTMGMADVKVREFSGVVWILRFFFLSSAVKTVVHSIYRVAQKKCIHSLLINIFGINLNEISISG